MKCSCLTPYWITFPEDPDFPLGMGVTAHSLADAYLLLEQHGYTFHTRAARVNVVENITFDDLDQTHVVPNMGPLIVRGVWFPCLNIGFSSR